MPDEIIKSIERFNRQWKQNISVFQEMNKVKQTIDTTNIAKEVQKINESIIKCISPLAEATKRTQQQMKKWEELIISKTKGIFEELDEIMGRFYIIIVELGWPPHESLDVREVRRIVKYYDEYGSDATAKELDKYFLKKYNKQRLEQLLEKWKNKRWLQNRIPILEQVLKAHIDGQYFLTVPTILPQIEGIIVDGYCHVGHMGGKELKDYYNRLLSNFSLDLAVKDFLFKVVLIKFEHGYPNKSFLSRHAILHGADNEYGLVPSNSLKCILLFDYLQERFSFVSVGNGKAYHLIDCPVVRVAKKKNCKVDWTLINNAEDALNKGKIPCKICKP